jgi:glutathione S-transferase
MSIVLWHCHDARSFRPLWALEELQLDYDLKLLPFPPRVHEKPFLGENPLGTVPLLVDGETRMTESVAILHYLAMVRGDGRFTLSPGDRHFGAYLNWLVYGEATLTFPQTIYLRYSQLEPEERRQATVANDYKRWFLARLRLAETALSDGRRYLVSDAFTMADISVAYAVLLAISIGIESELPPLARAWFRRLENREGFQAAKDAQARTGQAKIEL